MTFPRKSFRLYPNKLPSFLSYLKKHNILDLAFDWESTDVDVKKAEPLGFSLGFTLDDVDYAYYLPIGHRLIQKVSFALVPVNEDCFKYTSVLAPDQFDVDTVLSVLRSIFENPENTVYGHNLQYDFKLTDEFCIRYNLPRIKVLCNVFDTIVSSYSLHKDKLGLKDRASIELGVTSKKFNEVANPTFIAASDIDAFVHYCNDDVLNVLALKRLHLEVVNNAKEKTSIHYGKLPLINTKSRNVPVLALMETTGLLVDSTLVDELDREWNADKTRLEQNIIQTLGRLDLLLSSPAQMSKMMFKTLGWWNPKYSHKSSDAGEWCADKAVLDDLLFYQIEKEDAFLVDPERAKQVCEWYKQYSEYKKLLSSYIVPLKTKLGKDGRIHPDLAQIFVASGRLNSTGFNLQTIPSRSKVAAQLRKVFVARPGFKFVGCDLSQAEVRLLAHRANVKVLKEAFLNGEDVHQSVATQMGVERRIGKELNLGIGYGLGAEKLARKLRITTEQAKRHIARYHKTMPEIKEYKERCIEFGRKYKFARSILNHTRSFHAEIEEEMKAIARGEKGKYWANEFFNHGIQASNNDYITMCQVRLYERFAKEGWLNKDVFILLQVHDELLFEVKDDMLDVILPVIQEIMEGVSDYFKLSVRMVAEPSYGNNWKEAK